MVSDHHLFMGGVYRHDQLRLQRYSLQRNFCFRKYYAVNRVNVNAYVTYVAYYKAQGLEPMTPAPFMTLLHEQLIKLTAADFDTQQPTPTNTSPGVRQTIEQNYDFRTSGNQRMRRHNACKVCSVKFRRKGEKSNETSWYCVQCSQDVKRLFLCNAIRASQGNTKTCFDICHQNYRCRLPATATNYIQMRPTGQKRKHVRRALHEEDPGANRSDAEDFE